MALVEKIYAAGVVGAGGAGFPTHVKAGSQVEYFLVNGAECEPLIHKDFEVMVHHAPEIMRGIELMQASASAKQGFVCVKTKNHEAMDALAKEIRRDDIKMFGLGDFYPSGDEYEIVYAATKRLIPAGGIPLNVGCLVSNVETCLNVAHAEQGLPVTEKFVSVNGAVKEPGAFFAPIGASLRDLLSHAGGATIDDFAIYVSGLMMGQLTFDLDQPITKTTAGLIILPKDHYLIKRKNQPEKNWHRIGKSACDQCRYCTEFCPRYLLGYDVQPHQVMRSLGFTKTGHDVWNQLATLCCACGLCTLYACPEDLFPKEACDTAKVNMREKGIKYVQQKPVQVHGMKEARRVPIKQLVKRLNVADYDVETPYKAERPQPESVKILLKQHIGEPCRALVQPGDRVEVGQCIGEPPAGKLGARVHASISGTVMQVTDTFVQIGR